MSFKFTPQNLRRTFTTIGENLAVGLYILKKLLNHKSFLEIMRTENQLKQLEFVKTLGLVSYYK